MKPFLRDILFTFLLCLSLIVVLEIAIGKTQTSYSYKDWYMTEHADKIKILLLGNSFFENSFDPHVYGDSVFDGASRKRTLYYDVKIMQKYAPAMSNLEIVMVPLHPFLFCSPYDSLFYQYHYAKYMGIPTGYNPFQFSAFFSGNLSLQSLFPVEIGTNKEMDSIGYAPMRYLWNGKRSEGLPVSTYEEIQPKQEIFIRYISDLAQYCNKHGVRLILILTPASNLWIDSIDPRLFTSLDSIMDSLQKEYQFEYKFYQDDPTFRSDSLYADELHLNHIGATFFAKRVKEDFKL